MGKLVENNVIDSIDRDSKGTILRTMAIFTAMELCGSFLSGKTGPRTTGKNFKTFCESKYMKKIYHPISCLLLNIFRNGVAHSYISKGAALLGSDKKTQKHHLKFTTNGLFIYVPEFAKDIKKAIADLLNDIENEPSLRKNYKAVLDELDKTGKEKYARFIEDKNITPEEVDFRRDIIRDF